MNSDFETVFVLFNPHSLQPAGHHFSVTELATGGDLGAARGGIPSEFSPFDGGFSHSYWLSK